MKVRLLKDYDRDIEWWVTHPADPRFAHHEAGEELYVDDEEGKHLLTEGIAEVCE